MILKTPSDDLQVVFSEKFFRFNQSGSFSATQGKEEMLFFLDGLELESHQPSFKILSSSKFVIGVRKEGIDFYTIDTVVGDSFIGHKMQTHLRYILSPASISYLRGYLAALSHKSTAIDLSK